MGVQFPIIPILGMLALAAVFIGIFFGARYIVKKYKQSKFNGNKTAKKWYVVIILSVVIMILSWIFNMGWFRVVLTWLPLPLIHTIAFLFINIKTANKVSSFKKMKKYIILSCTTYLLSYLLFPDGGDVGSMYLFFGLIRNDMIANIMMYIAPIIFIVNITVLILECLELKKCKS